LQRQDLCRCSIRGDVDSRELWDPIWHVTFSQRRFQKPRAALGNFLSQPSQSPALQPCPREPGGERSRAVGWRACECGSLGNRRAGGASRQLGGTRPASPAEEGQSIPPELHHTAQDQNNFKSVYV